MGPDRFSGLWIRNPGRVKDKAVATKFGGFVLDRIEADLCRLDLVVLTFSKTQRPLKLV